MAVLISIHDLSHTFAARTLFQGLTFSIESGEKIALIGVNGAGKSTLMKIIAGDLAPDGGTVSRSRGLRVGYLSQVPAFRRGQTVRETVLGDLAESDDWENIGAAEEIMSRLGLKSSAEVSEDRLVEELSGGWKKKVALARELARKPDLLLLDEPTNHLDIESILWLERWVKQARIAVMTISHDREFLRRTSERVIEIDRRYPDGLLSISGTYDEFIRAKEEWIENETSRSESLRNTLRREVEWLHRGAKARTTKQKARIDRAEELKTTVADLGSRLREQTVKLEFGETDKNPKKLIDLQKVTKGYGERTLFRDLSLLLTPKTRLGLLGANGTGKSTLIKILAKTEEPDSGTVAHSDRVQIAYFDQTRETLDPEKTVLKTVCPYGETVEYQGRMIHVRSYLDRFLFGTEQMDMPAGRLSGGEQARLLIARLMLRPANILVLDEPTNDLDLRTLGVLEECLEQFDGAVILVSHDRAFLDSVCERILAFPEIEFYADVAQWESRRKAAQWDRGKRVAGDARKSEAPSPASNASAPSAPTPAAPAAKAPPAKKLSYNEQREFDRMEETILAKEAKLGELNTQLQDPAIASNSSKLGPLMHEAADLQVEIEGLYARWAELEARGGKKNA